MCNKLQEIFLRKTQYQEYYFIKCSKPQGNSTNLNYKKMNNKKIGNLFFELERKKKQIRNNSKY